MAGVPAYITPLSYIRGSGTQYITTEINLRSTDVVKSKWRFENSAGNVYGCYTGGSADDNFCLYGGSASNNAYIRYNGQLVRDFKAANGTIYNLEHGPDGFFANGDLVTSFTAATFTCSEPMYIFMLPNSSSAKVKARCYGLRIYRDGALAYNFIPARNELTSEVGMFEIVNGVWYGNAGTGAFTAGADINYALQPLLLKRRRALMGAATVPPKQLDQYEMQYFTIEGIEGNGGDFSLDYGNGYGSGSIGLEVSSDGTTWTSVSFGYYRSLSGGEKVFFRGNQSVVGCRLTMYGCYVYGNIMSLIDGNNALSGIYSALQPYAFFELFKESEVQLHSIHKLMLPAKTLASHCYDRMFYGCYLLSKCPALPATTLAESCYHQMFSNCDNISGMPSLPATALAPYCYEGMFEYTGIELPSGTILPAETLAEGCYKSMFSSCFYLTNPPVLPATTLAEHCYESMFWQGNIDIAPELPATTLAPYCYASMFSHGSISDGKAPILPATHLASHCYDEMFRENYNVNYIKALFIDTPGVGYTENWVEYVESSGIFVKSREATWNVTGVNGIPSGWTVTTA